MISTVHDPKTWYMTVLYIVLLVMGLAIASYLTEKMENSQWRQDLKAQAEAKSKQLEEEGSRKTK